MLFEIPKQFENQEIIVPIRTRNKERIVCRVYHPNKPNTVYFDVAPIIYGEDKFVIKVPKIPDSVILEIFNEKNGHAQNDPSFQIKAPKWVPIRQSFAITGIMDPNVNRFAKFLDEFAENAAILSARNSIYRSPDGKFQIDYKDVIRDDSGRELTTPLRVNSKTRIIEIAKKYYVGYTVPGRKMWAWHEFAHVWKNRNPEDELEADKHAIMIYLGFGNPIAEAYNVVLKVFKNTPSDLNKQRYLALNTYIKNFNKEMTKQLS